MEQQTAPKGYKNPHDTTQPTEAELNRALRILAESHTRGKPDIGYVVESTVVYDLMLHSRTDYLDAWGVVRRHLHMTKDDW